MSRTLARHGIFAGYRGSPIPSMASSFGIGSFAVLTDLSPPAISPAFSSWLAGEPHRRQSGAVRSHRPVRSCTQDNVYFVVFGSEGIVSCFVVTGHSVRTVLHGTAGAQDAPTGSGSTLRREQRQLDRGKSALMSNPATSPTPVDAPSTPAVSQPAIPTGAPGRAMMRSPATNSAIASH
jgi:hypothetical protein